MSLSAATVWEVRPTNGSDTNGGGFVTGAAGTDWSQFNSAQYAETNGTTAGTTTVLLSAASSDMVGNIAYIAGGTGSITGNWYQIVSVSAGTSITVDRSTGLTTGTGVTVNIGGAIKTTTQLMTIWGASNTSGAGQIAYVKAESTITFGSSQTWEPSNSETIIGYTTTRGDNGQVTLKWTSASFQCITVEGICIRNFIFNCNSQSGVNTVKVTNSNTVMVNCLCENGTQSGITCSNGSNTFINCVVTSSGGGGNAAITFSSGNGPNVFIQCVAYANAAIGFNGEGGTLIGCISASNTGSTSDGFQNTSGDGPFTMINCLSYKNGRDGWRGASASGLGITSIIQGCIFYGNTGDGMNSVNGVDSTLFNNFNAYGGNSANLNNIIAGPNDVTLSGDPTTAGASENYALNSTSGAGAACKAVGFPGVLQIGGTGYIDIGPLQSQASGGTTVYVINKNQTIFVGEMDA